MREFGGYQIQSDEYRLMYEQVVQENEHFRFKDNVQKFEIDALKKKLLVLEEQLQSKDEKVEQLKKELKEQHCETKQMEDKFEIQTLKTERVHQVRMEAEEKVVKLERIVENLKREIVKSDSARTILINQRSTLEEKVKEQDLALQQFVAANQDLDGKVADLTDLCKRAKKRIDTDEVKIVECNKFAASVRERDLKIQTCLDNIFNHFERKLNKRCFFISKCQRKNRVLFMLEELMHVVDNDVEADGFPSGDLDRQLM